MKKTNNLTTENLTFEEMASKLDNKFEGFYKSFQKAKEGKDNHYFAINLNYNELKPLSSAKRVFTLRFNKNKNGEPFDKTFSIAFEYGDVTHIPHDAWNYIILNLVKKAYEYYFL